MRKLPRVLVVEDEPAIAELISVNLRHNGFQPFWAEDGEAAQRELDAVLPDVILLDWMLPGQSGLQLARKWRVHSFPYVPRIQQQIPMRQRRPFRKAGRP